MEASWVPTHFSLQALFISVPVMVEQIWTGDFIVHDMKSARRQFSEKPKTLFLCKDKVKKKIPTDLTLILEMCFLAKPLTAHAF